MKTLISALMIGSVAVIGAYKAEAQETGASELVRVGAGLPGRGYDKYAQSLQQRLKVSRINSEVVNLAGSEEIAIALCEDEIDVAPLQIDALYQASLTGCNINVAGLYGSEYAFLMFPPGSKSDELSDLDENSVILTDNIGSGSDLFIRQLQAIDAGPDGDQDSWSKAKVTNGELTAAGGILASGQADAIVLVTSPKSAIMQQLIGEGFEPGEMDSGSADLAKIRGQEIYVEKKVQVPGYGNAWSYEVKSVIGTRPGLESSLPAQTYRRLLAEAAKRQ